MIDRSFSLGSEPPGNALLVGEVRVAELLGCPIVDPRVARCAFTIHAQCIAMMHRSVVERLAIVYGDDSLPSMVDNITEFSLAGLWALARTT